VQVFLYVSRSMSFVNENKDMSWRLRRGAAFFASPGR